MYVVRIIGCDEAEHYYLPVDELKPVLRLELLPRRVRDADPRVLQHRVPILETPRRGRQTAPARPARVIPPFRGGARRLAFAQPVPPAPGL